MSNLDKYIEVFELVLKNIIQRRYSESCETKRRIQELMFKRGLLLDVKNRAYLTPKKSTLCLP